MRMRPSKITVMTCTFPWFIGIIFVMGCAPDRKHPTVLPEKKFCITDLDNSPEYQQLLWGHPQTCGMRSGRVFLKPGESIGQHSTKQHEELLVFLSGQGLALIGENQPHKISKGKVAYIPPETLHNMKNTGTEPLTYIYCVAPVCGPN